MGDLSRESVGEAIKAIKTEQKLPEPGENKPGCKGLLNKIFSSSCKGGYANNAPADRRFERAERDAGLVKTPPLEL